MRKLKVCFVSMNIHVLLDVTHNKEAFIGGAELQQYLIGRELVKRGHEVCYITEDHGQGRDIFIDNFRVISAYNPKDGIPGFRFFYPRIVGIWQALNLSDSDIYFVRCAGMMLSVVVKWCRINNKKSIFSGACDNDLNKKPIHLNNFRDRLLYDWGLKYCDAIIVQNICQKEYLKKYFNRQGIIINNGYKLETTLPLSEDYVLWVGKITRNKRPELFIELAKHFSDIKFLMIGVKVVKEKPFFYEIVKKAAEVKNLCFKDLQPLSVIENIFNHADIFVNTSYIEGFPNTFLQAWSRGIPTVSYVDPDNYINKYSLGEVFKTKEDLIRQVEIVLKNRHNYKRADIKKIFEENFSIEKQVTLYEELFYKVLENEH